MMNLKQTVLPAFVSLHFLCLTCFAFVDTRAIDDVRSKTVLNSSDLQVIDAFVKDAVNEILTTRDFATISKTRSILLSRTDKQGQYAQQFAESSYKYLGQALQEADRFSGDRRFKVALNLLIVADALDNPDLVDLALPRLGSPMAPIAYWAARIATSRKVIEQASKPDGGQKVAPIVQALQQQVQTASPEVLDLIVSFAAQVPQGQDLLLAIADHRIAQYAGWTVKDEQIDNSVLKALCTRFQATDADKAACAQRFAQLYSYVIQRYAKGSDRLTEPQKQALVSAIVDVEEKCLPALIGQAQTSLRRAIERQDLAGLMVEHDSLLGSSGTEGRLPSLLHFSYSMAADGSMHHWPETLRSPLEVPTEK